MFLLDAHAGMCIFFFCKYSYDLQCSTSEFTASFDKYYNCNGKRNSSVFLSLLRDPNRGECCARDPNNLRVPVK